MVLRCLEVGLEVLHADLTATGDWILLACDGIFDVMENEEVRLSCHCITTPDRTLAGSRLCGGTSF